MTEIFLIIVLSNGTYFREISYSMPSWERCIAALREVKTIYSNGDESEGGVTIFCSPKRGKL